MWSTLAVKYILLVNAAVTGHHVHAPHQNKPELWFSVQSVTEVAKCFFYSCKIEFHAELLHVIIELITHPNVFTATTCVRGLHKTVKYSEIA